MRSSAARALVACAALLFGLACDRGTTAVQTAASISFASLGFPPSAGKPIDAVRVTVLDELGMPMVGAVVSWTADNGGSVSPESSKTDAKGVASTTWTPGPHIGVQVLHARSGQVTADVKPVVYENVPVRMELDLPDTLRFTSAGLRVHSIGTTYDRFGNPWREGLLNWTWRGTPNAVTALETTIGTGLVEGRGWLFAESSHYPGIRDSVYVIFDRIPVRIASLGPQLRSMTGGDSGFVFDAVMYDSLGGAFSDPAKLAAAGVTFASNSPAVASIDSTGFVRAHGAGSVVFRATAGALLAQTPFTVYQHLDLGSMQTIEAYFGGVVSWAFAPDGTGVRRRVPVIGAPSTGLPREFASISNTGVVRWTRPFQTGSGFAAMRDGSVLLVADGQLYDFNADGSLHWNRTATCAALGAVTSSGHAILRGANCLASIAADGSLMWTRLIPTGASTLSVPGSVYTIGAERATRVDEQTGEVVWSRQLPWTTTLAIADADGTIYLAGGRSVLALNADGSNRWESTAPDVAQQLIRDGQGGVIALTPTGAHTWDIATGSLRWSTTLPDDGTNAGAAAADDGRIYVTRTTYVYAFDARSGTVVGRSTKYASGAPFLVDGMMFIAGEIGARVLRVPFGPAKGWSQVGANAGMTNSVP